MSVPTVSVVVTCFNLGRYVEEAIDSVLGQSFQDFDIVVIDDGSTDPETIRVLDGLQRDKTRVVRTGNHGLSAARNLGAAGATGEFLCMVDADDVLAPRLFEASLAAFQADPELAFVSHWLRAFGDEEWDWTPSGCSLDQLLDENTVNGAALVRRRVFETVGGFDESFREGCEDWDLWISLVESGFRGHIVPEILFHYRRRPQSMSRLLMDGDRFARVYRALAEKHSVSFGNGMAPLIAAREREIQSLRAHLDELDFEFDTCLEPERAKLTDDLAALGHRVSALDAEREAHAAFERVTAELDSAATALAQAERERADLAQRLDVESGEAGRLRSDLDHLASTLADADARYRALAGAARDAHMEAEALRQSVSWRLTAPGRRLYEAIRRFRRP